MHYVIGSGPAGVAAASALLDRGLDVTMLDVGEECDPDRLAAVTRIAATRAPEQWTREDFRTFRGDSTEQPAGSFPIKRMFGSDFAYAADDDELRQIGTSCVRSHAKGGLSNVWGAAVLPNLAADLDDWPVTLDDLKPHYARVAQLMPVAGAADDLDGPFPLYERPAPPLRPSRLAAVMLARMRGNRERLSKAGLRFGQSRLAVRTDDESGRGCQYTGLCLSGCPYFAIWNSATVVNSLRQNPRFTYQPGWHVDRIEPASAGVRLIATRVGASDPVSFEARHAFVACGPIATMRVVIDSLRAYDRSFSLRFQPYFLLPFVALDHTADVEHERLHTLAQIFIELVDAAVSSHTVHLQVYTFNQLMP